MDMDSTFHEQCGEQMEGLNWNYKNQWGLESQVTFDEWGFCHGVQLRPGNTKSGVDADRQIQQVFDRMKFAEEKYFRADSAYCYSDVIKALINKGVKFTLTAHDATTQWESHIPEITEWKPWIYSEEEIKKAQKRGKILPLVEIGRFLWTPGWAPNIRLWVIVKRTWQEGEQLGMLPLPGQWKHYGIVTNFDIFYDTMQSVMQWHYLRGNAERYVREEKYGYDFHHLPCQSLKANHAFLLLGMISHNILRWVALVQRPDKPHFSKKIRRRFIYIPGKIIKHARQLILKIPTRFYKEVHLFKTAWTFKPCPSLDTC
jgi:hypothetical protein